VSFASALADRFPAERIRRNAPLAPLTTFRVGGPADWLLETRSSDEILSALKLAHDAAIRVTLLGGGSNVLVADSGVRGLVVRPRGGEVQRLDDSRVRADASVTINGLVRWLIGHAAAGLEEWAGTPGTVGGAVFGNAHFGGRLIGNTIAEVRIASLDGTAIDVPAERMEFGYDRSRLQTSREVLLSAVFRVHAGDPAAMWGGAGRIEIATSCPTGCRGRLVRWSIAPASRTRRSAARACRRRTRISSSTTAPRQPATYAG
jgi:UDP-N-acetylenolpyruvoylglucosamine reductase